MKGSSPAQANTKRNKTIVATGISLSATLPKNPVPKGSLPLQERGLG